MYYKSGQFIIYLVYHYFNNGTMRIIIRHRLAFELVLVPIEILRQIVVKVSTLNSTLTCTITVLIQSK